MQSLTKPQKLQPGDKVAAVSLSWGGPGALPARYQAGVRQLEEAFGVQVVEMAHTLAEPDWLHAHPQARAEDLMQAFSDPQIRAIFSTIGGDDSIRTLPYLDLEVIRNNPKIFMGYSDSTVTHFACLKAGLGSFYGPSIMSGFGENAGLFPYMAASVRKTLFESQPIGKLSPNMDGWTDELLDWGDPANQSIPRKHKPCTGWKFLQGRGIHSGRLMGGCIEVLDWLRGTDVWPDTEEWEDTILFIETSEEAPSPLAVERMLARAGRSGRAETHSRPAGRAAQRTGTAGALCRIRPGYPEYPGGRRRPDKHPHRDSHGLRPYRSHAGAALRRANAHRL